MFVHDAEFLNISCVCVRWWSKWLGVGNLSCGSRRAAIFLLWHVESPRAARPPPPSLSWGYHIIFKCTFPGAFFKKFLWQLDGFLESLQEARPPGLSWGYLIIFKCSFPGAFLLQLDGFLESPRENALHQAFPWAILSFLNAHFLGHSHCNLMAFLNPHEQHRFQTFPCAIL